MTGETLYHYMVPARSGWFSMTVRYLLSMHVVGGSKGNTNYTLFTMKLWLIIYVHWSSEISTRQSKVAYIPTKKNLFQGGIPPDQDAVPVIHSNHVCLSLSSSPI